MNEPAEERRFLGSVKKVLDGTLEGLDHQTLTGLARARRRALEDAPRRVPRLIWAGTVATVAVALAAVTLWQFDWAGPGQLPTTEDIEILASSEDLELYEDLDFYRWLAHADVAG